MLLQGAPPPPGAGLFIPPMRDLGYIEGQNLIVERRFAEGRSERFPVLANELVAWKPDVLIAESTAGALAAKRATSTIPIVIINVSDPVASGLVQSLARSENNITGSTDFGTELAVKSVEYLLAVVPKASRIAVLMSDNPVHPVQLEAIREATRQAGVAVLPTIVTSPADFEGAFAAMQRQNASAMIHLGGAPVSTAQQVQTIAELALKARLPAIFPSRFTVLAGGLMSYGVSLPYRWRLTANYVDKILKGAKPGDLPVQRPTVFEFVINMNTAKTLGLTVPERLLLGADEIVR
jgi:putative ABC transport system substrate-binding protein